MHDIAVWFDTLNGWQQLALLLIALLAFMALWDRIF